MENLIEWVQVAVVFFQMIIYIIFAWWIYAMGAMLLFACSHMLLIVSCLGLAYCFYRGIRFLRTRHSYLDDPTVLKSPQGPVVAGAKVPVNR